jgi:hypothetical protein
MNDDTKEMLYKIGGMGDPTGRYPQRPWVGLIDEERNALLHLTITHSAIEFGKAIEAKLKEKNT